MTYEPGTIPKKGDTRLMARSPPARCCDTGRSVLQLLLSLPTAHCFEL